jgi:hypothetical protein
VFVFAPEPASELVILDAYIVACLQSGIEPVIVFNKADLLEPDAQAKEAAAAADTEEEEEAGEQQVIEHKRILGRSLSGRVKTGTLLPDAFPVYADLGFSVLQTSTLTGAFPPVLPSSSCPGSALARATLSLTLRMQGAGCDAARRCLCLPALASALHTVQLACTCVLVRLSPRTRLVCGRR